MGLFWKDEKRGQWPLGLNVGPCVCPILSGVAVGIHVNLWVFFYVGDYIIIG